MYRSVNNFTNASNVSNPLRFLGLTSQNVKKIDWKQAPNTAERHHICKVACLETQLYNCGQLLWPNKDPLQYQSLFSCFAKITSDLCFNLGSPYKSETIQSLACYETFRPRIMKNSLQFYLSSVSYLMKGLARLGLGLTKMKPNYHPALNLYLSAFMAFLPKKDMWRDMMIKMREYYYSERFTLFTDGFYDEGL